MRSCSVGCFCQILRTRRISERSRRVRCAMSTPFFRSPHAHGADEGPEQLRLIDTDLIEKIMSQALIDAGYYQDDNGVPVADYVALKGAVVQTMLEHHIVKDGRDMS